MRSHAGVALKMFETLAAKGINIQVISTSEIKVSVLVAAEYTELAVRALHTAYELDATSAFTRARRPRMTACALHKVLCMQVPSCGPN